MKNKFIVMMIIFIFIIFGCQPSNKKLANSMLEKYCDDNNYVKVSGIVMQYDGNEMLVECNDLNKYISYENGITEFYVYSNETLDIDVGNEIEFITVPYHFYNGHKLPIVAININENILLSFEDGKENLIEWVNYEICR